MSKAAQEYVNVTYPGFDVSHKKKCKKCKYRTRMNGGYAEWNWACQYILIEKKRRPCPANECTVYEPGMPAKTPEGEMFMKTI